MRLVFAHPLSGLLVRIDKLHDRYLHPMGHCNFRLTSGKIIVASLAIFMNQRNIEDLQVGMIPGYGHYLPVECPDELARRILTLLGDTSCSEAEGA
jgi:pimeloyl-ACP methyl ester carboxylesterase